MEIETLFNNLVSNADNKYRRKEIEEALTRREEIIPFLFDALKKVLENPENIIGDYNHQGHIYALMLLGHFKEKNAHDIILKIFSLPEDIPYQLFGDIITEDLPIILLNTCGGCFDGIKNLALNTRAYEYCRGSALKAMMYGVAEGSVSREEVLSFYKDILEKRKSKSPSFFFDELASCVCDLFPHELMDIIVESFEDGYIHPGYIGIDSFEDALKSGKDACMEQLKRDFKKRTLDDIHSAMSWWACFEENKKDVFEPDSFSFTDEFINKSHQKKKKKKRKMSKSSKRKNRKKK